MADILQGRVLNVQRVSGSLGEVKLVQGPRGEQGIGIEDLQLDAAGNLKTTLTDGREIDSGNVAAPAEAWAAGTREGEPVEETDPAHQNNARHWALQAAGQAQDALESARAAEDSAAAADISRGAAAASAGAAEGFAEIAGGYAEAAESYAGDAERAADAAEAAQDAIENMGVEAVTGQPGTQAAVGKTIEQGAVRLTFTIPRGEIGKDAYTGAVEAGYTGTEAQLYTDLAGLGAVNAALTAILNGI